MLGKEFINRMKDCERLLNHALDISKQLTEISGGGLKIELKSVSVGIQDIRNRMRKLIKETW